MSRKFAQATANRIYTLQNQTMSCEGKQPFGFIEEDSVQLTPQTPSTSRSVPSCCLFFCSCSLLT